MFEPTGFSQDIFKKRYAFTEDETWPDACKRVARQAALAELPEKQQHYQDKFQTILQDNLFVPGGRVLYGSGRNDPNLLNCFVLRSDLDSRQGWGSLAREMIETSMMGGGCGVDFSAVRPKGAPITSQSGSCPGPVELMRLIDRCADPIRAGGQRRVALMFSLDLDHPDVVEFLDAKLTNGTLTNANVSVRSKRTAEFIKAVRGDGSWELSWKGKFKKTIPARFLWDKIVKNAYNSAEPGFLNWEKVERESNIAYTEELVTTNPCFSGETLITTRNGMYPIKDLVGKTVEIWSDGCWRQINNFRVTGKNQKILKITLHDGSSVRLTPYHSVILENGTRKEAKDLTVGERLKIASVKTSGTLESLGAYLQGFLVGDGTLARNKPHLWLYNTKYECQDRLVASAKECGAAIEFTSAGDNRKKASGLSGLARMTRWCAEYKRRLPTEVFQYDSRSRSEFVAGVMDADGTGSDTPNGFMYQICSIHKGWLEDFQTLLKSMGVASKIALMKKASIKDFGDGYGEYASQDCYRLTISQAASIILSEQVTFARLPDFSYKTTKYEVKPRFNRVVAIEEDGVEPEVYCCTVEGTHSLAIGIGVEMGQCGEIALGQYDCCCLGHIVLHRFVQASGELDFNKLGDTVRLGVRFLDDVLSVNSYPLPEMREKSHRIRRIGLGTTGLADVLALLGLRYGGAEANALVDKIYRFISKAAYEASVMLAIEKGAFPACDPEKHLQSDFMRRMPAKIRSLVREHGIRNCAILTQAPTGTVSILSGNCSSGIEPMFAPAYERRYFVDSERKTELVFHPLFSEFMKAGKSVDHFVGARDLSVREHMEVQATIQKHIDNAVSKTINVKEDCSVEEMAEAWLDYLPALKGTTFYRENTRGFYDEKTGKMLEPPLVALPLEEAIARFEAKARTEAASVMECPNGLCSL